MRISFWLMLTILTLYLCILESSLEIEMKYTTHSLPELQTDYTPINDYPIRMCGNEFLRHLKRVCAIRGIYTPLVRFKRSLEQYYDRILQRGKRFDDLCTLYTIYEPDQVVTKCCCIGCTRSYLEQFCNPG
ncbi:hypothetical protein EWB00_009155 [Schistosoma japonicum]|uniref:Insulin-like domain-containing protein n=2 Tax=Schistosoma japonicum TaxID=6182 RepID=A0A4Z2CMR0_SCHJA|nr:hypothetical protein EWB00_009155 [Schistosoma japonicum]TNN05553.1 hypothetical protein EWB00_009155 [Schistosoma japonicum]